MRGLLQKNGPMTILLFAALVLGLAAREAVAQPRFKCTPQMERFKLCSTAVDPRVQKCSPFWEQLKYGIDPLGNKDYEQNCLKWAAECWPTRPYWTGCTYSKMGGGALVSNPVLFCASAVGRPGNVLGGSNLALLRKCGPFWQDLESGKLTLASCMPKAFECWTTRPKWWADHLLIDTLGRGLECVPGTADMLCRAAIFNQSITLRRTP
jgi:hypothetical protein